ncbi:hypothetical protein DL98DRAFT_592357 [Cadophora sp. DSE1049]|nr:hypothetical protein DL98DRAFT_592357 [Cadophora sp. DSE1049]
MPFRTCLQLVVVMLIREILGQEGELLPCVVQDVQYSGLDKEFLKSLDITVVDDPDAFDLLNANTLVVHRTKPSKCYDSNHAVLILMQLERSYGLLGGSWPASMITENNWANPGGCLVSSHDPACVVPGLQDMFEHYNVDDKFVENRFRPPGVVKTYTVKDKESFQATTEAAGSIQECPNPKSELSAQPSTMQT